jgi:hypothetical protein
MWLEETIPGDGLSAEAQRRGGEGNWSAVLCVSATLRLCDECLPRSSCFIPVFKENSSNPVSAQGEEPCLSMKSAIRSRRSDVV